MKRKSGGVIGGELSKKWIRPDFPSQREEVIYYKNINSGD
jgi:hypothetical protein